FISDGGKNVFFFWCCTCCFFIFFPFAECKGLFDAPSPIVLKRPVSPFFSEIRNSETHGCNIVKVPGAAPPCFYRATSGSQGRVGKHLQALFFLPHLSFLVFNQSFDQVINVFV